MGKFSGAASVRAAQEGKGADLTLPTGDPIEASPAPSQEPSGPSGGGLKARFEASQKVSPEQDQVLQDVADVTAPALEERGAELAAEEDRFSIPSLAERLEGQTDQTGRWLQPELPQIDYVSQDPDGGLVHRAVAMGDAVADGALSLFLTSRGTSAHPTIRDEGLTGDAAAEAIAATGAEGNLFAAISRAPEAVLNYDPATGRGTMNPLYAQVGGAVVENEMFSMFSGEDKQGPDQVDFAIEGEKAIEARPEVEIDLQEQTVTQAANNKRIGNQIHLEYQRLQGIKQPEPLPNREAETLGSAFKSLWHAQNPTLATVHNDPQTNQNYYQLTSDGEYALRKGDTDRKNLFPKIHVRPAKQPNRSGKLPGDVGKNVTKPYSGRVGKADFSKRVADAMINGAKIPNVVDKQRAKLLYATFLPVLKGDVGHDSWQAEIYSMGVDKIEDLQVSAESQKEKSLKNPKIRPQTAEQMLASIMNTAAQEVQSLAQERHGANYLSYFSQGFQGRITPQQSYFNPTSSKIVRFATRNATPSRANPGSRVDKNLRQMYAMMLLPKDLKADVDLPHIREQKLRANESKLSRWGERLKAALVATDEQYEAVSQAIADGLKFDDPNFPQIPQLNLDPVADAELIKHIESKGEDGPAVMDGLIDFANYLQANKQGKPYHSYFNAYMDGKTNGIATNGMQMGIPLTAYRTGVIRKNPDTLLDNGEDVRDALQRDGLASLKSGWNGNTDGFELELNDVTAAIFNNRDFNKMTTMTFGYGKEMDSYEEAMNDLISKFYISDKSSPELKQSIETARKALGDKLAETIMEQKYGPALVGVMSQEALDARAIMRSAAALHAATNSLMTIIGPTGMEINLGRDVSLGSKAPGTQRSTHALARDGEQGDKSTAVHYQTEPTTAAIKTRTDKYGNPIDEAGGHGYGGSVVAPVQAMDAATVALMMTGESWNKLSKASGGNPYIHTIYDAFKVDANGYDVVLEEVNKNWMDANMKWSYLQATYDTTKETMKQFHEAMEGRNDSDPLTANERLYMDWILLSHETDSGHKYMKNFFDKITSMRDFNYGDVKKDKAAKNRFYKGIHDPFVDRMEAAGYNFRHPPENPTVGQLKVFVKNLQYVLGLSGRLSSAIKRTNKGKAEIAETLKKEGYKSSSGEMIALQYYAH